MSNGTGSGPLVPTFHGFVMSSMDGLVLFEACLSGKLHHVPRRPHDRERANLIKSGSIFIYEENASGIKRWTDGVAWSPSRILGNFLLYRELEKPFGPGEKKRAVKRKRSSVSSEQFNRRESDGTDGSDGVLPPAQTSPKPSTGSASDPNALDNDREQDRQLVGSLVDSYGFRDDGLVKKTMSVTVNGVAHHLVSYYTLADVKSGLLQRPMSDSRLAHISVRPDLFLKQNFRSPVEESEHYVIDSSYRAHPGVAYGQIVPNYGIRHEPYMPSHGYQMYSVPTTSASMYAGLPAVSAYQQPGTAATTYQPASTASPTPGYQQARASPYQHSSISPGMHSQQYSTPSYSDYYNRNNSLPSLASAQSMASPNPGQHNTGSPNVPSSYSASSQHSGTAPHHMSSTYAPSPQHTPVSSHMNAGYAGQAQATSGLYNSRNYTSSTGSHY